MRIKGFLGTGAAFDADLNLVVQLIMGVALLVGALLAKQKCYKAHAICQATVLLLNLVLIAVVMWPSFLEQVEPARSKIFHRWYYGVAMIHAVFGITAEIIGLYIVLVVATRILPQWLRFKHWKWWMRAELALWEIVLLTGVGTYCIWYVKPLR